jgi:hypothetical protein
VRATLAAVGAANTPIYVTEVGWPTHSSAEGAGALPDATRSGDLALLSDVLARSDCGVSQLVVYTWSSPERDQSNAGDWFGIAARDGGPTVSSRAYSDAIRRDSNGNLGPTLPVCSGPPIRGAQALDFGNAAQVAQSGLTLGLSLRKLPGPRHRACYRARVTYQGLPINRAAVRFGHLRPLSRRNRRAMTGRTGSDGAATLCGRRGRARVVAVASLAGIAASPPATAGRR